MTYIHTLSRHQLKVCITQDIIYTIVHALSVYALYIAPAPDGWAWVPLVPSLVVLYSLIDLSRALKVWRDRPGVATWWVE